VIQRAHPLAVGTQVVVEGNTLRLAQAAGGAGS
jgi:hypothetical protein